MNHEFVKDLKPGDKVITHDRYNTMVRTVSKITKTMVVLDNGERFNRESGREVGRSDIWYWTSLEQYTEERENTLAYEKKLVLARTFIRNNVSWKSMPDEVVLAVLELVQPHVKPEG